MTVNILAGMLLIEFCKNFDLISNQLRSISFFHLKDVGKLSSRNIYIVKENAPKNPNWIEIITTCGEHRGLDIAISKPFVASFRG